MMLKKFRCLALVLALVLVTVSCTTFAAKKKQIKLVYGTTFQVTELMYKGDLYFKKLVEKKSKGKILVEVYPAGQLGSIAEMLQATKAGSQQMVLCGPGAIATYWSKLGTFDLPYLYRDQMHSLKTAQKITSLINQNEMAAKTGMRILGARIRLPRQLTTTKSPINKLEEVKGLKIRVPQNPLYLALWKALGAVPTVIPWAETQTALTSGVVDAQENPVDSMLLAKIYEQTKYCAMTSHVRDMLWMTINDKFWKSLTKAQRKIIQAAAEKSNKYVNYSTQENEKKYVKSLTKVGVVFTHPDVAPFREKAKTIWSQFGDMDLIEKVEALK
jgi:tripartite ATP-independent transporter DctP family solute receptor